MLLKSLSILGYRNIREAQLSFSPGANCLVGGNGEGKTNLLDAIYQLSMCKGALTASDECNLLHGGDCFVLSAEYLALSGSGLRVSLGMRRGARKRVQVDGHAVSRFSDHIGRVPLVLISPDDAGLVTGPGEARRRLMDTVLCQTDKVYLQSLMRYNRALAQRGALLKAELPAAGEVMDAVEAVMSEAADYVYRQRSAFVAAFAPEVSRVYAAVAGAGRTASVPDGGGATRAGSVDGATSGGGGEELERVDALYVSHGSRGALAPLLREWRERERRVGYTLHGPHRDDVQLEMGGHSVRGQASQGQLKTLVIAMKLAQYSWLLQHGEHETPLLLLDDVFDKLDAGRVERLVRWVAGSLHGQLFITDTQRERVEAAMQAAGQYYALWEVHGGCYSKVKDNHSA